MLFPSETFQLSTALLKKCVSRKLFELEIHLKAEMNKLFHLSDTYKPHRKSWEVWTLKFPSIWNPRNMKKIESVEPLFFLEQKKKQKKKRQSWQWSSE